MLKLYRIDRGQISELDLSRMDDALWIDAIAPSTEEVELLNRRFGVQLPDIADCLDPNERSRVETDEEYDLVVLRNVVTDERGTYTMQTIPIGIFVLKGRILTVRIVATFAGNELIADCKRKPRLSCREDLFLAILGRVNRGIDRKVRPMEGQISIAQKSLLSKERAEFARSAYDLSSGLILFNTTLLSNYNAISMIARARHIEFNEDQTDVLEDLENDVAQLYEMTTIYREIMSNVLRAYESAISNNLSTVMKVLTSISLILMLPTLIASLYGMNIDLPFAHDPYAFYIVIGFSAFAVAMLWVMFRIKKIL